MRDGRRPGSTVRVGRSNKVPAPPSDAPAVGAGDLVTGVGEKTGVRLFGVAPVIADAHVHNQRHLQFMHVLHLAPDHL